MRTGYIYKITSPTGKIYIGKTTWLYKRKSNYKQFQCKQQRILYNSLKKYGFNNHNFDIILEKKATNEELYDLEIFYIEKYNSYIMDNPNGMNLTKGGDGFRGNHTEATKLKISNTKKNTPRTQKQKDASLRQWGKKLNKTPKGIYNQAESRKIPILQLDKFGNFIKEWKSAKDVQIEIGLCRKNISCNLRGKTTHAYGYIWKYK